MRGEPFGFYTLVLSSPQENEVELKQIYIRQSQYGTGLGRRLHDDALTVARQNGSTSIWLHVSDKNVRAWRFYETLGYERSGTGPIFKVGSDRLSSTRMQLDL